MLDHAKSLPPAVLDFTCVNWNAGNRWGGAERITRLGKRYSPFVGRKAVYVATADAGEIAALAVEEVKDGIEVLTRGSLSPVTGFTLMIARGRLIAARLALEGVRTVTFRPAMEPSLVDAIASLRAARNILADPSTLPPSFQR